MQLKMLVIDIWLLVAYVVNVDLIFLKEKRLIYISTVQHYCLWW
jgi:hypothetical protein